MGPPSVTTDDYRRAARRLRWIHRDNPRRRVLMLRHLSNRVNALRAAMTAPEPVERKPLCGFAEQVAEVTRGPALLYSDRLRLLTAARRQGIGRFEANLIIAAVQHRMPDIAAVDAASEVSPRTRPQQRFAVAVQLAGGVVALQGLILTAAWWVLRS